MGSSKKADVKKRLSLETSAEVRDRMERLRDMTGAQSITQVICQSLLVYEALMKEQKSGGTVILRTVDGHEREILIL